MFCFLAHTHLTVIGSHSAGAHLAWRDWFHRGVAWHHHPIRCLDGNARKQHGGVSVCVRKIHISLITKTLNSGRLGPALCLDTRYTYRVGTVNVVQSPRVFLKLHQWVHLRLCWQCSTADDAKHQIQVFHTTVLAGGLSRSVTISP